MKILARALTFFVFLILATSVLISSISSPTAAQAFSITSSNYVPVIIKINDEANSLSDDAPSDIYSLGFQLKRVINERYLAGSIPASKFKELAPLPMVERVWRDELIPLSLDQTVPLINATKLHDIGVTGQDQTICIIDTGIDYTHPDLGGCFGPGCKVVGGWDYVDEDSDPFEAYGEFGTHGNLISIVAAGSGPEQGGINTGVAPDAQIVAMRACISGGCFGSDVISSIQFCNDNVETFNIKAISMSFSGERFEDYCDDLRKEGLAHLSKHVQPLEEERAP